MRLKKILIVEDDKPVSRALSLKLEGFGFACTPVEDGETALKALKSNGFDLVILDLVMPHLDGFDVLKEMRRLGDKTPVLVVSNLSQEEDQVRAKSLGALEYFVKSDTQLVSLVQKIKDHFKHG
jgi:DNA-binding response OmpR family regulator